MALRLSTGLVTELMGDGTDDNSLRELLKDGVLDIYSGSQPSNADATETGVKLVSITESSGAFVGGAPGNGLEFDAAVDGELSKAVAETWSGNGIAIGTAGWFRFYNNAYILGESTVAIRFDGNVSTAGSQLILSSTAIQVSLPITIDTFTLTQPKS